MWKCHRRRQSLDSCGSIVLDLLEREGEYKLHIIQNVYINLRGRERRRYIYIYTLKGERETETERSQLDFVIPKVSRLFSGGLECAADRGREAGGCRVGHEEAGVMTAGVSLPPHDCRCFLTAP